MLLARLLVLRSLRTRPVRSLLSAFGIVLGVAGMLAIAITNLTALDAVTRLFKDTSGRSSLVVTNADISKEGFADSLLRRVQAAPGVAAAAPSLQVQTTLADDAPTELGLSFFGASSGGLALYGIDAAVDGQVREYKMVAGHFLQPERNAYEVVLVKAYAEEKEIALGQTVAILTPTGVQKLKVVGLMDKEGPGRLNNGAFGVIPLGTAQELFNRMDSLDQIDIVARPDKSDTAALDALREDLTGRLGEAYAVLYPASQGRRMTQMLNNYQVGLNFLSGIALFVGAFLIYNAFAMTVVERTREFGLQRTLGMTRKQVTRQVQVEAVLLGAVGSLLGAGLGIVMARGLTQLMATLMGQEVRGIRIAGGDLAGSISIGVVVTLVAALIPAWQAGRISPLEALRIRSAGGEGRLIRHGWKGGLALLALSTLILIRNPFPYDVQFRLGSLTVFALFLGGTLTIPAGVDLWERMLRPLVRRLYGSSGWIGSSNVRRARLRTTLTVAALMIGVAMVVVVSGMTQAFKADVKGWVDSYIGGDLFVHSSATLRTDLLARLGAVEGVDAVAPVRYVQVKWARAGNTSEVFTLMGVDPVVHARVTRFVFADEQEDAEAALARLAAGDAVFISSVIAERYGLQRGEHITLKTRSGPRDFAIAAVVVDYYNQGLVLVGNWNDMRRYFGVNDATACLVKVRAGAGVEETRSLMDRLYGPGNHLTIESNRALKERVFRLMDQSFSLFDALAVVAVLVAALGIINTLTMNVMERTREIGMLRAVGMTGWQVVRMILAEAGLMGLMGGALGAVFGAILSRIFLVSMASMSGYKLAYVFPAGGVGVALGIAVAVSQLAAILPARRAARLEILQAIHYE